VLFSRKSFPIAVALLCLGAMAPQLPALAQAEDALLSVEGVLEPGDETLEDESLFDSYSFEGRAGQTVTIVLESVEFDPYLLLLDAQQEKIAENDDFSEENRNSALTVTLPEDGIYWVVANAYDAGGWGQYQLTVSSSQEPIFSSVATQQAEANRLFQQGIQQYRTSQFRAALQSWEAALKLYREIENRAGESKSLGHLGLVYDSLGQYKKAIEYHQQSLAINREIGDLAEEGYSLGNLGNVFYSLGQYEKAIEFHQQSLAINREIDDGSADLTVRAREGASLNNLGLVYRSLGAYEKAIEFYHQSLAIQREIGDRAGEGNSLNNLGNVYLSLGQYKKAIEYHQQSLAIDREIGDRAGEGDSLNNLGLVYRSLGEYEKAIEYHQQSLAIDREIGNRAGEGASLNNLGNVYDSLGQYKKAIEYHQQSLAIDREIDDRAGESKSLGNLGAAYDSLGQYEQAIEFHQQSLAIKREIGDRAGEGASLNNLGSVYDSLGEYEKAIEFYQQSLAIDREIGNRAGEGASLNNLGNVYDSLGEYEKAIEYHQQSLAIDREIGDLAGEGNSLNNLGLALYNSGQLAQAEEYLRAGIEVLESVRSQSGGDANKISIFDTQARTYRIFQQVLIAQNKTNAALEIAERGRARAFVELLSQRLSPEQSDTAPQPPTIEQIKQIAQEQNATLVEYSIITDELEIAGKKQWRQSQLYIWVVKPTGEVSFRTADLTELAKKGESLNTLVAKSRHYIGARGRSLVTVKPAPDAENINRLRQLHEILIEPIADLLPTDPEEKIIFLPQGPLFLVPFPALQDEKENYLIENHTILTAPAIQVLQLTREQRDEIRRGGFAKPAPTLIVGNPTMPSIAVEIGETPTKLKQLPGAEREAKNIAQLLVSEPLIGTQATRKAVVEQMSSAKIIHLATHGLLDDFKGQGVPGAIALAPDGTGKRNDGLLTSNEILDLNLSAELVVLSACDTGRGEITGDGVIGLSRSLVLAGVPSLVVSLWAVDDYSTAFLMSEFYKNWQQTGDKAQSLRQAMLATREKYPEPEHWAAFTLIGESE